MEGEKEPCFFRRAASLFQHRLGGAFFVRRAAETAHRKYADLEEFGMLAQASSGFFQYPDYPTTLS